MKVLKGNVYIKFNKEYVSSQRQYNVFVIFTFLLLHIFYI